MLLTDKINLNLKDGIQRMKKKQDKIYTEEQKLFIAEQKAKGCKLSEETIKSLMDIHFNK